ncbi:SDR family NAD(P)-dependent oxidoreductase [Streptomyces sedi]|uniref:SDR family oxidoreductase n=1 Tax=Streptomyces sedi TaxID=555059 RepID=A0A5C4USM7_9ACTN|nr:SDR family oxidoreductase [Streptomyces sedi]TNM25919.1 SDR family oxidoreductase [Streptomyces sedi]
MDLRLTNTAAVVTGASRGIGLAIVRALTAEGVRVAAAARTITPELKETGALAIPLDLVDPGAPAQLVDRATTELGDLDLLVNNVGGGDSGGGQTGGFLSFTDQQWQRSFDLNFLAAVRTSRAALPSLLRRCGALVNVSSNSARMPHAGPVPYTTAKAALTAFGKALAEEFGPQGLRVNTISPGAVRTALLDSPEGYGGELARSMGVSQEQLLARLPAMSGMTTGRLLEPSEVATAVAYLASPLAASMSGSDLLIDGGSVKTV